MSCPSHTNSVVPSRRPRPTSTVHGWLNSWAGIGHVVAGMARQGYDLELRRYDGQGWRAMFFPSGFEHSLTSHAGSAWAPSPWAAVQRATWKAPIKEDRRMQLARKAS